MPSKPRTATWKVTLLFLAVTMMVATGIRSLRLNAPFTHLREREAAFYANELRNWHRFGLSATRFFPSWTVGKRPPENLEYHVTHWPLPLYIVYGAHKLMGVDEKHMPEWSIRIVPILFSVLTIPLLYVTATAVGLSPLLAGTAAGIAALSSSHAYFSQSMACNFATTLFFMLLAFWRYLSWDRTPSGKNLVVFILSYTAALYSLWEGYYLFPAILLYHGLNRRPGFLRLAVLLGMVTAGIAAIYVWHVLQLPSADTLMDRFRHRSSLTAAELHPLSYLKWIFSRYLIYYTLPLSAASLYWLVCLPSRWKTLPHRQAHAFGLCVLVMGLWDILLLPEALYSHDYILMGLFFFAVISPVLALDMRPQRKKRPPWREPLIILVLCAFLAQTTFHIYWRFLYHYHTNDWPLTYELSRSVGAHTAYGEEVLTDITSRAGYNPFYADSLILLGIDTPEKMADAKHRFPDRHFRYLVTTTRQMALEGIDTFRRIAEKGGNMDKALADFGIQAGQNPFHRHLEAHYRKTLHPPFVYYDIDSPRPRQGATPEDHRSGPAEVGGGVHPNHSEKAGSLERP